MMPGLLPPDRPGQVREAEARYDAGQHRHQGSQARGLEEADQRNQRLYSQE